jgi:cobyrinic acid a,c-diamide synthase
VGVFPFKTVMTAGKLTMGYVEVLTGEGCPLFPPGTRVRGQVFHYSEIVQASSPTGRAAFAAAAILPLLLVVTPAVELGREDG